MFQLIINRRIELYKFYKNNSPKKKIITRILFISIDR